MPVAPMDIATLDLIRGNTEGIALASAVRAASNNSPDITNYNNTGAIFYFNVTAVPGVDTVQFTLEGKDPVSGSYRAIWNGAVAIAATGLAGYLVYPGASGGSFTAAVAFALPRTFRVRIVHSAATNFTYSVGYAFIP